ncbi:unknown protein [Simkania negevensis Z]|uniref:Uncharacterized protein n=1 Tax=Simkania negevensis (strain ATCC VR-1471 / DSM 27360 / Z) TaxID=331113 RepID=F8L5I0_SIMNZ|nr:unknown protein [Simkania negevensis Z]
MTLTYHLKSIIFASFSSQPFCLEKDRLVLSISKNTENLKELSLLRLSKINPELRLVG